MGAITMKNALLAVKSAIVDHPRTTAIGIAGIVGAAVAVYHNPSLAATSEFWLGLLTAIGLLAAADAKAQQ